MNFLSIWRWDSRGQTLWSWEHIGTYLKVQEVKSRVCLRMCDAHPGGDMGVESHSRLLGGRELKHSFVATNVCGGRSIPEVKGRTSISW